MEFNTDNDAPNVLGGTIFICYIVAALLLTGLIVLDLYKSSLRSPPPSTWNHVQQLFTFSVLAVLSFVTLSYHMLSFLITAYSNWAIARGLALPQGVRKNDLDRLHLWQWARTSKLFQDFATNICMESNGNWWWTEHTLIFSMAWNIYMAVEGNLERFISFYPLQSIWCLTVMHFTDRCPPGTRRRIPRIWFYFALDQILPVSFTMNLFFLAVLLEPAKMSQASTSGCWSAPGLVMQVLPLAVFFATLSIAPLAVDSSALIPVVLLARLLLFLPFLAYCLTLVSPTESEQSNSGRFKQRHKRNRLWLAYKATTLTLVSGYVFLQLVHTIRGTTIAFPFVREILSTVNNDSAVSALGYDLLIAMVSWAIWYAIHSKNKVHAE